MPEVKNTFLKSKMNKDLDARILPNGEYRDAQNVSISKSEDSNVGAVENILSNSILTDVKGQIKSAEITKWDAVANPKVSDTIENALGSLEIIGQLVDPENNRAFFMLTNYTDTSANRLSNFAPKDYVDSVAFPATLIYKGACCYICQYDFTNNTSTILVSGSFLNFSKTHTISGISILEDLLFWTDNRNQPRKINIQRAVDNAWEYSGASNPYYFNEDHISVARFSPVFPISLIESDGAGDYDSTMISASEEFLPPHLIDAFYNYAAAGGSTIQLNRSVTFGSSTAMLNIGDKVTIIWPNDGGIQDFTINNVTAPTTAPGNDITTTTTFPKAVVEGTTVMFSRANPLYDPTFIGDKDVLKEEFIRFSYRFKFDDGEYSLVAPFTQSVFIPKQHGYFVNNDEENTGDSGVVSFVENLIDKVKLNIRLPWSSESIESRFKISELQILSKSSDELSLRVIDDIDISDLSDGTSPPFFQDYLYTYNSAKPYKTLPDKVITRVNDKTPIRALCQDIISNRVVYGNYVNKHSSLKNLLYEVNINKKSALSATSGITFNQIKKEYPNHTVKQNRSYTVGIVLLDRYGRSSNVILAKENLGSENSTIYAPYSNTGTDTVLNWPGNLLEVDFKELIPDNSPIIGYPGLYSSTNPLGWYSYKIVVKQQEQEYYNVYVAGVLAGDFTWGGSSQPTFTSANNVSNISLFGDNINKIPRDLSEIGPLDKDYGSSTLLYNRVNPNSWDIPLGMSYNTQYNTDQKAIEVSFIKAFKDLGDWTTTKGNLYPNGSTTTVEPWYSYFGVAGVGALFADPLFKSNDNPFVAKLSTKSPIGVNPIERRVLINYDIYGIAGDGRLGDTDLGVFETEPTESKLDIFWETSSCGLIEDDYLYGGNTNPSLNNIIRNGVSSGPTSFSNVVYNQNEVDLTATDLTNWFECLRSDGNPCVDLTNTMSISSVLDGYGNERKLEFTIVQGVPTTNFKIQSNSLFYYGSDAGVRENYKFYIEVTANGITNTILLENVSLSNNDPINISFNNFRVMNNNINVKINDFIPLGSIRNGSSDTTRNTLELKYKLGGSYTSNFKLFNKGVDYGLEYLGGLVNSAYVLDLIVTDADGLGDSISIPFTINLI